MPGNDALVPTSTRRPFMQRRFPILIIALAVVAIAIAWGWPAPDMPRLGRVNATVMTAALASVLLLGWFLVFSGFAWMIRIAGVLLVVALGFGTVRGVRFSGDMVPSPLFRWEMTPDEALEAHRRSQAGLPVPALETVALRLKDFPAYRGALRDGIVAGPPLVRDWREHPPRELWRQPVGGGYASIVVAGQAAVTIEQRRDQEAVVCYDTATGRERWVHRYPAFFRETLGGPGPRATPTIADGEVYSLGATGVLVCLDLATGQPRWSRNILEGNANIQWGMSGSPLVLDHWVIVNPGVQTPANKGKGLAAFDRKTGQPAWASGDGRAGYSSPMLADLAGTQQILLFDGESMAGYDAKDGKELWRFPWPTYQGINVAQPLVLERDRVFLSAGYDAGCAMLQVAQADGKWSVKPLWQNKNLRCKFTSPVLRGGFIYGLDEGVLVCLDAETGQRRWRDGRYGHGQLLLADDLLVILGEEGQLALVEAKPEGFAELGKIRALHGKTWNYLAIADGRAYVRNDTEIACYDLRPGTDK